jgi:hypothetical protein
MLFLLHIQGCVFVQSISDTTCFRYLEWQSIAHYVRL